MEKPKKIMESWNYDIRRMLISRLAAELENLLFIYIFIFAAQDIHEMAPSLLLEHNTNHYVSLHWHNKTIFFLQIVVLINWWEKVSPRN